MKHGRPLPSSLGKQCEKKSLLIYTIRENVWAKLRTMVKRILRKYGYPPDKQEKATQTILKQAELLGKDWK